VDTLASAVVFTATLTNMSAAAIPGVYFWRSCDPDNDESWSGYTGPGWTGGSFTTNNMINAQNDVDHRVAVTATGQSSLAPPLTLCTKDCRAVAVIYSSWGLSSAQDLAAVWSQTYGPAGSGAYYNVGVNHPGDIGIGLVYNIGTLAASGSPGSVAIVSYAYVFNGWTHMDDPGALPDPVLSINGVQITSYPDTLDACAFPGVDSLPVDVLYGNDKDWTISKWTWSPALGLSTTAGVNNYIHIDQIPGDITYTVVGTDSIPGTMLDCNNKTFVFTVHSCHDAWSNRPCYGDSLHLRMKGDSIGATYRWYGPNGFTSTLHNSYIFPAVWADTGKYHVIRTIGGVHDTDSTVVFINPRPTILVSNNGPLCQGMNDTLSLSASLFSGGETFSWIGPGGFTSTLEFPTIPGFGLAPADGDTGIYKVIATTVDGCKDTAYSDARTIPQPLPPIITDSLTICQRSASIAYNPFTVTSPIPGIPLGTLRWWPSATGGTSSPTPTLPNTNTVGVHEVWASQITGSCESPRGTFTMRVVSTPLAPTVTGRMDYCQFIGPVVDLTVTYSGTSTVADSAKWYAASVGGTGVFIEPLPNINLSGPWQEFVSVIDSGCEGPRTPTTITIHPKPAPPVVTPTPWCQLRTPGPIVVNPSGAGDVLTYYGPGITPPTAIAPTPSTIFAPDTIFYYITETTVFGCISDSATDKVLIIAKPPAPVTRNISYCQGAPAALLNAEVDSLPGSFLKWYYAGFLLTSTPQPVTDTTPGSTTWYVSQTVNTCEGDSSAVTVNIVNMPKFSIAVSSPYVCQYDSATLAYFGPAIYAPTYTWTLPAGAVFADGSHLHDSVITVAFDTANLNNYVQLTTSDDNGFCSSDTTVRIKVVSQPVATAYTKPDVCLGDTVQLALSYKSLDAYDYTWYIDDIIMSSSGIVNIIASSSNNGGPFDISWADSGRHVIKITTVTEEGCQSAPTYDSIQVHALPDPTFKISGPATLCIEDSVQFTANTINYNNSYVWEPAADFNNLNSPQIWGKMMQQVNEAITLTVTDPYGCKASASLDIEPGTCCTLLFPNAFTPNGDLHNDVFRPIFTGYHKFHEFRIANRWGQTIFESAGTTYVEWDGNYNGVPQDMGVYYFYIKYDCGGATIEQKGDVTLIR